MAESPAQSAAAGLIDELVSEGLVEPDEASAEDAVEQQQEEETPDTPGFSTDLPLELEDLFNTPDFDEDEEDDTPSAVAEEYEVNEYDDEDKQKMARQLNKLNKQLAWERSQKVNVARKAWSVEATKYFQFSNPEVIQADSRRSFLKQAKAQHDAVAKVAKPIFDQLKADRASMKEELMKEARTEAERRWGRPPQGTGGNAPPTGSTDTLKRERITQSRGLKDVILARMKAGEVNI